MKKYSFLIALIGLSSLLSAQCVADYDFGGEAFGIYPDPTQGQSFKQAEKDLYYADTLHFLVPLKLSDVVSGQPGTLDSLRVYPVQFSVDDAWVDLDVLGLSMACNNGGSGLTDCTFAGGGQYCGSVYGTPNRAGEFLTRLNMDLYVTYLGQKYTVPYTFESPEYLFVILGDVSVREYISEMTEVKNVPNPFRSQTRVEFTLGANSDVHIMVHNLVGEKVYSAKMRGKKGSNEFIVDAANLEAGIYLYTLESDFGLTTHRMIKQ